MREKEKSTQIIYVRHGVTDFPIDRIYCDAREDPALNATGIEQANEAADMLQNLTIDAIYASPALRTRMTAEAIQKAVGVAEISFDERLRERRFGIWDGLFFDQIERDYPEDYQRWKRNPSEFKPEGGESVYDLRDRVSQVIDAIRAAHQGQTIVVVAHVGPLRALVTEAIGMPLEGYRQLTVDYASLTRVDYGKRQNNLIFLNVTKQRAFI